MKSKKIYLFSFCTVLYGIAGCSNMSSPKMEGISIVTVAHYGKEIGIPEIYVNGSWAGNQTGWGGGGGDICCAKISADRSRPVMVKVEWETCDVRHIEFKNGRQVDPSVRCKTAWHVATVPVHFSEKIPSRNFGLNIHFLPGHKIEAWTSDKSVLEESYPGQKYPDKPVPHYVPLAGEDD